MLGATLYESMRIRAHTGTIDSKFRNQPRNQLKLGLNQTCEKVAKSGLSLDLIPSKPDHAIETMECHIKPNMGTGVLLKILLVEAEESEEDVKLPIES